MAKSYNLFAILKTLPEQAQRQVYFTLAGSLNMRILNAARNAAFAMMRRARDNESTIDSFNELSAEERWNQIRLEANHPTSDLYNGSIVAEPLENAKRLNEIASYCKDELVTMKADAPTFVSSMELSERPQAIDEADEAAIAEEAALLGLTVEELKEADAADQARMRGIMHEANLTGLQIISTFEDGAHTVDERDAWKVFETLDEDLQYTLQVKVLDALDKAKISIRQRGKTAGRSAWDKRSQQNDWKADIVLINDAQAKIDGAINADVGEAIAA